MTESARKVLVLGADGFIGRHLAYGLRRSGWDVLAVARRPKRLRRMGFDTLKVDLTASAAADPAFWKKRLPGVTHVVNAAGVLNASDNTYQAVHVDAPDAVYSALPESASGLLISAVGIEDTQTAFAQYRRAGEETAARYGITVLRAGLVLGETSYGGSSLLRAMAAMPFLTPVVGRGDQEFTPVHISDLTRVVVNMLDQYSEQGIHEIGGPEIVTQAGMVQAYRRWFGLGPAFRLRVPVGLARLLGRMGDAMRLGPISATAVTQLQAGVVAHSSEVVRAMPEKVQPRGFSGYLAARPAGTQDLWHARLYLLRPALRITLALLWAMSGLIGLTLSSTQFLPLVPDAPVNDGALVVLARLGGVVDLVIALALLRGWRPRLMAGIQAAMVLGYTIAFSVLAPVLWLLPLGGLLKNIPILALIAVVVVLEDER